mmetsp:Transcript_28260/g.40989  ORF Transcript_28260/g.40989 Transcript_28260/m.40989 type:complete len:572 (+) Transcript_28260:123-1838(+)
MAGTSSDGSGSFLFQNSRECSSSSSSKYSNHCGGDAPSSPPSRRRTNAVPSLVYLCVSTITSKIERYPPECLGALSETEWESICKLRHKRTCPRQKNKSSSSQQQPQQACLGSLPTAPPGSGAGIDGTGRMAPAISDKIMKSIEDANRHLASSKLTDTVVWKDCVEYRFRIGGPSRPPALFYPWPILVERLKKAGSDLTELVKKKSSSEGEDDDNDDQDLDARDAKERMRLLQQAKILDRSTRTLAESPMTLPLLSATKVGKSVSKFIKGCNDLRGGNMKVVDVWTPRRMTLDSSSGSNTTCNNIINAVREEPPIERLERLLSGWKDVASAKGVTIRQKFDTSSSDTIAGKGKRTSDERHKKDLAIMQSCQSWRELHASLVEREADMMKSHGERMRKIRDNLDSNKKKIAKVSVRPRGGGIGMASKAAKREAILSGQRGLRATSSSSSSSVFGSNSGGSKIQQLRRETAVAATFSKGGQGSFTQRSKSSFTNSMAIATASAKNATLKRRYGGSIGPGSGGGGKQMTLPKTAGVGRGEVAFSSLRQERDKKKARKGGSGGKSGQGAGKSYRR